MATNPGFGLLGHTLAGGNAPSEMMAEAQGTMLGANTQNVMAEADLRRSKLDAQVKLENEDPATMAALNLQPGEGKWAAMVLRAGGNPQEFAAAHKLNMETKSRAEIADPNTTDERRQQLLASFGNQPFKPYEAVGANTYAKTMDPNAKPVTDNMGNAMIGNYNAEADLKKRTDPNISKNQTPVDPNSVGHFGDQVYNGTMAMRDFTGRLASYAGPVANYMAENHPDFQLSDTQAVRLTGERSWVGNGANAQKMTNANQLTQHMDLAREVMAKLDNGENQTANQIKQAFVKWTGGPAPTNVEQVKRFLGAEVERFVQPGQGTGEERLGAQDAMSLIRSPGQSGEGFDKLETLVGGRFNSLRQQRIVDHKSDDLDETRMLPRTREIFGKQSKYYQMRNAKGTVPASAPAAASSGEVDFSTLPKTGQ